MSGAFKAVKKVFKKVSKVALPLAAVGSAFIPGVGPAISGTLGSILSTGAKAFSVLSAFSGLSGAEKQRALEQDPSLLAEQRRQEALLQQQKASLKRQQNDADKREEQLSSQQAAIQNAILARRSGRSGTRYVGPTTKLKTILGGQ